MNEDDTYKMLATPGEGLYKEKGSKFIAETFIVMNEDQAKAAVASVKKKYFDARHHCYAYMIGPDKKVFRSSDDGEPSGTAGKPILNQILSKDLTYVCIVVTRYFGGIKLGTSGLIVAYREAAKMAIEAGEILECHEQARLSFTFPYLSMNDVMKVVKKSDLKVIEQAFDNVCIIS